VGSTLFLILTFWESRDVHEGQVGQRVTYLATYLMVFEQLIKTIAPVPVVLTLITFTFRHLW